MLTDEQIAVIKDILSRGAGAESWMKENALGRVPRLPIHPTPHQRRLMGEGPDIIRDLLDERELLLAALAEQAAEVKRLQSERACSPSAPPEPADGRRKSKP